MSTITAQNINLPPLITHQHQHQHSVMPFMRHNEAFFKMKTQPDPPLQTEVSQSTNDLLERIGLADIEFDEPQILDPSQQRVSRHLSGGGLLLKNMSSYQLSTNPFKNKLRLILEEEERRRSTNPFNSYSLRHYPRNSISQVTQTASEVAWLVAGQSVQDLICLQKSVKGLLMSGWYHENVSWKDSRMLLQNTEPGTFLVRDSSDPNFLFSLSVQTIRGPTSVRLHYIDGRFRLDADPKLVPTMPSFENVIELIEYYVINTGYRRRKNNSIKKIEKEKVWIDLNGQVYSNIFLSKPLIKDKRIPKLAHLCRLKINTTLRDNVRHKILISSPYMPNISQMISQQINMLHLPQYAKDFLNEYPYSK